MAAAQISPAAMCRGLEPVDVHVHFTAAAEAEAEAEILNLVVEM